MHSTPVLSSAAICITAKYIERKGFWFSQLYLAVVVQASSVSDIILIPVKYTSGSLPSKKKRKETGCNIFFLKPAKPSFILLMYNNPQLVHKNRGCYD